MCSLMCSTIICSPLGTRQRWGSRGGGVLGLGKDVMEEVEEVGSAEGRDGSYKIGNAELQLIC
jgi:hypothetical protein